MNKPKTTTTYRKSFLPKQTDRIKNDLETLGLDGMRFSFEILLERAVKGQQALSDFFENLLDVEIKFQEESRIRRRIKQSQLPPGKTLDNFDFSFPKKINQQGIKQLTHCRFIDNRQNVIFFGPSGVGKTHLSIALGIEAIHQGWDVRFITLRGIKDKIDNTLDGQKRERFLRTLVGPSLLVLDEIDLHETDENLHQFLFKLLYDRYEKKSTIFTSNRAFDEWRRLFRDQIQAMAIISRIAHNAIVFSIEGEDYRIKGRQGIANGAKKRDGITPKSSLN